MVKRYLAVFALVCAGAMVACASPGRREDAASAMAGADPEIAAFVAKIRAVDNHSHANSIAPGDADADALPLDGIAPFEIPIRLRPDNPDWLAAYRALYGYPHADLSDAHLPELRGAMQRVARKQGAKFPAWVLDQIGTEVLLANRIAMGPGLAPPRVRWVSYVDALMLPLVHDGRGRRIAGPREAVSARGRAPAALPVRSQDRARSRRRSTRI